MHQSQEQMVLSSFPEYGGLTHVFQYGLLRAGTFVCLTHRHILKSDPVSSIIINCELMTYVFRKDPGISLERYPQEGQRELLSLSTRGLWWLRTWLSHYHMDSLSLLCKGPSYQRFYLELHLFLLAITCKSKHRLRLDSSPQRNPGILSRNLCDNLHSRPPEPELYLFVCLLSIWKQDTSTYRCCFFEAVFFPPRLLI